MELLLHEELHRLKRDVDILCCGIVLPAWPVSLYAKKAVAENLILGDGPRLLWHFLIAAFCARGEPASFPTVVAPRVCLRTHMHHLYCLLREIRKPPDIVVGWPFTPNQRLDGTDRSCIPLGPRAQPSQPHCATS